MFAKPTKECTHSWELVAHIANATFHECSRCFQRIKVESEKQDTLKNRLASGYYREIVLNAPDFRETSIATPQPTGNVVKAIAICALNAGILVGSLQAALVMSGNNPVPLPAFIATGAAAVGAAALTAHLVNRHIRETGDTKTDW